MLLQKLQKTMNLKETGKTQHNFTIKLLVKKKELAEKVIRVQLLTSIDRQIQPSSNRSKRHGGSTLIKIQTEPNTNRID
jgi:hypothetical protein